MPGRPRTCMAPSLPCISGRPGRIATFQNESAMPSAANAFCTRSYSPTEAPPVVTRISAPDSRARRTLAIVSSSLSPTTPEIDDGCAFGAGERGKRKTIGIDDLPRAWLLAGRHQFVAGGKQRELRPAMHRQQRMVHAGGQLQVARRQPVAFGQEPFAGAEIEPLMGERCGRAPLASALRRYCRRAWSIPESPPCRRLAATHRR